MIMVPGSVGGANGAAGNPYLQNSAFRLQWSISDYMNAVLLAKTFDSRRV